MVFGDFVFGEAVFGDESSTDISFTNSLVFNQSMISNIINKLFADTTPFQQLMQGSKIRTSSMTDSLAFTGSMAKYEVVGTTTNALSLTQTLTGIRVVTRTTTNALVFNQTMAQYQIVGTMSNSLTFTHSMSGGRTINRSFRNALAFIGTMNRAASTISSNFRNTLNFNQSDTSLRIRVGQMQQSLIFSQLDYRSIIVALINQSLTFTQTLSGIKEKYRQIQNALSFSQILSYRLNKQRSFLNALHFEQRMVGYVVSRKFVLRSGDYIVRLPQPQFGNRDKQNVTMNLIKSVTGRPYTYIKKPETKTWLFDFQIDYYQVAQVQQFLNLNHNKVVSADFLGRTIQGKLMTNPVVFTQITRSQVTFSLSLNGVELQWTPTAC